MSDRCTPLACISSFQLLCQRKAILMHVARRIGFDMQFTSEV